MIAETRPTESVTWWLRVVSVDAIGWRSFRRLEKVTRVLVIVKASSADLTVRTFPDGNHSIQKCETGGFRELLKLGGKGKPCDGYYETMLAWLKLHRFGTP